LPVEVAFVITLASKREGGLVSVLLFFIFVAVVGVFTLALGYVLSAIEEPTASRRCGMSQGTGLKRKLHRQRVRCRFEG
jgi:hypothetical protein